MGGLGELSRVPSCPEELSIFPSPTSPNLISNFNAPPPKCPRVPHKAFFKHHSINWWHYSATSCPQHFAFLLQKRDYKLCNTTRQTPQDGGATSAHALRPLQEYRVFSNRKPKTTPQRQFSMTQHACPGLWGPGQKKGPPNLTLNLDQQTAKTLNIKTLKEQRKNKTPTTSIRSPAAEVWAQPSRTLTTCNNACLKKGWFTL